MVCVVDSGRPSTEPTEITNAVAVSMQKPREGVMCVHLTPSTRMML
jgi:hypothetical protein